MKTKTHVFLAVFFALVANLSCTKTTEGPVNNVDNAKPELVSRAENIALSNQIVEEFEETLPPSTTVDQLFSPLFQGSPTYSDLASSSITILQTADILDSVKYYLNISSNTDPHLILAAKIVTEMYDSLPSGGSVPKWLGCLLGAGLGITPGTITSIIEGGTLWHVGQAIKHMGVKWFAKTVAKTIGGLGAVIFAADFTICMVTEVPTPTEPAPGGPTGVIYAPAAFVSNPDFNEYHKEPFIAYINNIMPSATREQNEQLYSWGLSDYGNFGSEAFYYVNEYFKSIYETD